MADAISLQADQNSNMLRISSGNLMDLNDWLPLDEIKKAEKTTGRNLNGKKIKFQAECEAVTAHTSRGRRSTDNCEHYRFQELYQVYKCFMLMGSARANSHMCTTLQTNQK